MAEEFEIRCIASDEGVAGGLKIDGTPKSYNQYRDLFSAALGVRQIDDYGELRIKHYPQFRPFDYQRDAVKRMLSRFRGKGIFGDQVGLGKTIEVGMTIAEYAERGAIKNVLLLCPNKLDFQWRSEISSKFDDYFEGFLAHSFEEMAQHERTKTKDVTVYIMTFDVILAQIKELKKWLAKQIEETRKWLDTEGFRAKKADNYRATQEANDINERLYKSLGENIDENYLKLFDLQWGNLPILNMLVVDEADALLSTDPTKTLQIYSVVEHIGRNTSIPYRILMSATPIRRQLADVFRLIKIVRPDQFTDMQDFFTNYCFGYERLNEFKDDELGQLRSLIEQLFTRNRLTSARVQQSLKPLTIAEVLDIEFANFSTPNFEMLLKEAVLDGVCYGEPDPAGMRKIIVQMMDEYLQQNTDEGTPELGHWTAYVGLVLLNPDERERPRIGGKYFAITAEKNAAFAKSLYARMQGQTGAEADALLFACEDYVVPPKSGTLIRYKGEIDPKQYARMSEEERRAAEEKACDDALMGSGSLKMLRELGIADDDAVYDKYSQFDDLINHKLKGQRVLVFSDAGAERNTFIGVVRRKDAQRILNGEGDVNNENYLKFASVPTKEGDVDLYKDAVYFAVNGEEKGFNMQFCSHLVITNLSHDPNLVEQIVGRISRIGQKNPMHIYVFTPYSEYMKSLEYYLFKFYDEVLHLFSDWDGDNTFIIGGAVATFLDRHPEMRKTLNARVNGKHTKDGEQLEIGFPQIVEYLWERYEERPNGQFDREGGEWQEFIECVKDSIQSFKKLVEELGDGGVIDDTYGGWN